MFSQIRKNMRYPSIETGATTPAGGAPAAAAPATAGAPTIVGAPSDDPLTQLRHQREQIEGALEEIRQRTTEQGGINQALIEATAEMDKRLGFLEDKRNNPKHRWWGATNDQLLHPEQRKEAVKQWMGANFRANHDPQFKEAAAWRDGQVQTPDSKGGYLIPVPLMPEVIAIMDQYGVARRLLRVVPVTARKTQVSTLTTKPLVYWPEDSTIPTVSEAEFGLVNIEAKLMMALGRISLVVEEDEAVGLTSFLIDVFTRAAAKEEDTQAFGTGTSPFTGLMALSGIPTHVLGGATNSGTTSWVGKLTFESFIRTMQACDEQVVENGAWLLSREALYEVMNVKDNEGRPLWTPGLAAGPERTILGRPYVVSNVMPKMSDDGAGKIVMAYGDWSYFLMADRRQLTIDFSDIAGFTSASRFMRLLQRVGFQMTLKDAFAFMKTASS